MSQGQIIKLRISRFFKIFYSGTEYIQVDLVICKYNTSNPIQNMFKWKILVYQYNYIKVINVKSKFLIMYFYNKMIGKLVY